MSPIERPLSGDVLIFDLQEEAEQGAKPALLERSGRIARTLLKEGALRVTLVVLSPGGSIPEHHAEGPLTVQPLQGGVRFTAGGEVHELAPGQLLSLGPGVRHAVAASEGEGATFLLTHAHPKAG